MLVITMKEKEEKTYHNVCFAKQFMARFIEKFNFFRVESRRDEAFGKCVLGVIPILSHQTRSGKGKGGEWRGGGRREEEENEDKGCGLK